MTKQHVVRHNCATVAPRKYYVIYSVTLSRYGQFCQVCC